MNYFKTLILLTLLTLLLIGIGQAIGGPQGAMFAFILSVVMNFGAYWFSDKIVLSMYRAKLVSESQAPQIYRMVRDVSQSAHLPMPKIYIIPQQGANAFATGRNPQNAVVAVTEGILDLLSEEELRGVLAHELAHVKNRDILIGTIVATVAGAIMMLTNMARWAAMFGGYSRDRERNNSNIIALLAITILAPIAALIIQMAISRGREYLADETGAKFLHTGIPLANALRKLESQAKYRPLMANPQSAHMFIVNPLSGQAILNLFSTHPPIQSRIKRLQEIKF
jgi:heat shock protein HtpX